MLRNIHTDCETLVIYAISDVMEVGQRFALCVEESHAIFFAAVYRESQALVVAVLHCAPHYYNFFVL